MKRDKFWTAASRVLAVATVTLIVILVLAPGASAASYKVLYQFTGGGDGSSPSATLVFDASGALYGTTNWGGCCNSGTVFQLVPNGDGTWTKNTLYSFTAGTEWGGVMSKVIFDGSGNLYGTTLGGGDYGGGTVYELTPNLDGTWSETVLHSFNGSDGSFPVGDLLIDATGTLYGTTARDGAYGHGVVFKVAPNSDGTWTETTIHDFEGSDQGGYPDSGGLILDAAGNMYGVTAGWFGGDSNGTVYELTPNSDGSWTHTVLHSFLGGKDGSIAEGTLIFDQHGNLYGVTWADGAYGHGTAFKLTQGSGGKWRKSVLHNFKGGKDGSELNAGLIFDAAWTLYGMTVGGGGGRCQAWGTQGCGTVFKLTRAPKGGWAEHIMHRFRGPAGGNPGGGLVARDSKFYGATGGDSSINGSVFEITP